MQFLLDKITNLDIGWNERVLCEDDAFELARRLGVSVQVKSMSTDGFYFRLLNREFITVNRDLPKERRLKVLFHELAHLLFHAPESGPWFGFHGVGKRNRQEKEADIFALCALLPLPILQSRSSRELIEEGHDPKIVEERFAIFSRYGI